MMFSALYPRDVFQSTRPLRGATALRQLWDRGDIISIHAPLAGRDGPLVLAGRHVIISIHAPLAGRDGPWKCPGRSRSHFNPRAPCGARLPAPEMVSAMASFQSTRPLRGATGMPLGVEPSQMISIHAPLAGRDLPHLVNVLVVDISIHAPLAGRDKVDQLERDLVAIFQSTRPLRGATPPWRAPGPRSLFQSTRPLRGATGRGGPQAARPGISIHAPLAGRDTARP